MFSLGAWLRKVQKGRIRSLPILLRLITVLWLLVHIFVFVFVFVCVFVLFVLVRQIFKFALLPRGILFPYFITLATLYTIFCITNVIITSMFV